MAGKDRSTAGQDARRDAEEWSRALMTHIVDGMIVIDEAGLVSEFNPAAEAIFGYRAAEAIGRNVSVLMEGPDAGRHDAWIGRYLDTGAARIIGYGREVTGRRKDGRTFPMDLAVSEVRRADKRYFIGTVRDISERKAMEQQLRQAYKMEALGQLTGGVAHDFNNLLAVLMMDLELLGDLVGDSEEALELVTEAREVAQSGAELTQRLLAFSRRQTLEPKIVDLNAEIGGFIRLLRRTLGEHIEIDTVGPSDLWDTVVDPGQFENAILNLAINARDAMPDGGRLTIETANEFLDEGYADARAEVAVGEYVLVSVTDTGTGMAAGDIEKAFDPFFTTKPAGSGSGLGLSMVYGFAKQSGGHVSIYSEPGHGTTVNLFLPRAADGATAARPARVAETGPTGAGETILLVEDHPQLRNRAEAVLRELGYEIVSAASGDAALAELEGDTAFDLLFTDVVMPGELDGPQLAAAARQLRPGLRILFTTGYAEQAQMRGGLLDDGGGLIRKPYTKRALALKIREVLGG